MNRSLRWRIQLWYGGLLALVLAGFVALVYARLRNSAFRGIDADLEGAAANLVSVLRSVPPHELQPEYLTGDRHPPHRPGHPPPPTRAADRGRPGNEWDTPADPRRRSERRPWMDNLELPPGFVFRHERTRKFFGVWHDAVGSLARSDNAPALSELTLPAAASVQPYFYARRDLRIVVQRGPPGTIVAVGLSVDHELEHLNHWLLLLLGGAGGIYVLALAGGYWLSGRALQPITEMSACAAAISAENLSQRIDVAATDAELAQLGTTLNDTFARLEQAFARQAAFTADASHELRTPLTIVLGHLELLLKKSAGREGHEELQACFRAAKRMKGLVEQLLLLARADAGKLATSAQSFDLFAVVEECVELLHPLADAKEIKLTVKGKGIEVHGDPQLLALVVTNLVTNAIQHHRVGGRVEVEVTDTPEAALLHVADNGPGIPVEAQSRLFERFFRVDESRSRDGGGNGLGLALARSVVRLHGGEVTFRSEVDCGTAFLVRLPRQVSEPQNA